MDPLSDVLRVVRLTGGVFLDSEFTAPWCVISKVDPKDCWQSLASPAQLIGFHYVVSGRFVLRVGDGAPIEVAEGHIVLLPRNDTHVLGSTLDVDAIPGDTLVQVPPAGGLPRIVHGGGGAATRIVCGYLGSEAPFNLVTQSLPKVLALNVREGPGADWIETSFRFAAAEVEAGRVGSETVLSRLSELLFVEAVRRYVATLPPDERGWLAGLRDPVIGRALAMLHGRIAHDWTAESLAREVGLSRSAFADRFTAMIGDSPMRYLAGWRLQVASQLMRDRERTVAQAAFDVGYESEAAFNRAFKRKFGVPPATWRNKGAAQAPDAALDTSRM